MRALAAAAALLLVAAGCGQGTAGGDSAAVVPAPAPVKAAPAAGPCPEQPADARALPADAAPSAVVGCLMGQRRVAGDGMWRVRVDRRATDIADIDRLVAALRLPSERRTDGACTLELRGPQTVALEIDGRVVHVMTPRDACSKPLPEVMAAYEALRWTETGVTKLERVRSEAAVVAGCEEWKDMIAVEESSGSGTDVGDVPMGQVQRVCLYRTAYPAGWTPDSGLTMTGEPVGGFTPSAEIAGRIAEAIDGAGPAALCGQPRHSGFAVVMRGDAKDPAYVELDGCNRILAPDNTMRQGTAALVKLLTRRNS